MSRQSYATPLTAVSTDIEVVGGKNAVVGDQRDDIDGNRFMLVKAGGTVAVNRGVKLSGDYTIVAHTTMTGAPFGVTIAAIESDDYTWCQVGGVATIYTNGTVGAGEFVFFTTGGAARGYAFAGNTPATGSVLALGPCVEGDGGGTSAKVRIDLAGWWDAV